MAEKKETGGAVTEHYDAVDDLQKSGNIKEANVASVALGKIQTLPTDERSRPALALAGNTYL